MLRPVTDLNNALADYTDRGDSAQEALTRASVGWSGKNQFRTDDITRDDGITVNSDGSAIRINNSTSATYRMGTFRMPVTQNTDYIFTTTAAYTSGGGRVAIADDAGTDIVLSDTFTENKAITISFNSGNNDYIKVKMLCTLGTATIGDITYNNAMLRDARIKDSTFEPYHKDVEEALRDAEVVEGKNLQPFHSQTITWENNAHVFTADSDGYITCNRSDTRNWANLATANEIITLKAGTYFVKAFVKTASTDGYLGYQITSDANVLVYKSTDGLNSITGDNFGTFTLSQDTKVGIVFKVGNGSYAFMICTEKEWNKSHAYAPYYVPVKDAVAISKQAFSTATTYLTPLNTFLYRMGRIRVLCVHGSFTDAIPADTDKTLLTLEAADAPSQYVFAPGVVGAGAGNARLSVSSSGNVSIKIQAGAASGAVIAANMSWIAGN